MSKRDYPKHPEWTKYPAINGIEKPRVVNEAGNVVEFGQRPVRSDVQEYLEMEHHEFARWYNQREAAINAELERLKLIASIPDLRYGAEETRNTLGVHNTLKSRIDTLRYGLECMVKIRQVREEIGVEVRD